MAGSASYLGSVNFNATTNPPVTIVGKVKSCSFAFEREKINVTPIGQTAIGGEDFILGKYQGQTFDVECYRDLTDTGQAALHAAVFTGDGRGYMTVKEAAAAGSGYGFMVLITGASAAVGTDGAAMIKFNCTQMGKVVLDNGTIPTLST